LWGRIGWYDCDFDCGGLVASGDCVVVFACGFWGALDCVSVVRYAGVHAWGEGACVGPGVCAVCAGDLDAWGQGCVLFDFECV